jgi:hypothetical protein
MMSQSRSGISLVCGLLLLLPLMGCAFTDVEGLQSLRAKPALPYSVLITGGGFVQRSVTTESEGLMSSTCPSEDRLFEAFALEQLRETLDSGNVFVTQATDTGSVGERLVVSGGPSIADADLQAALTRARAGGHDFLLVVERIRDGAVEMREINERWPFTVAAWLFAMGSLISDHTYESGARLRVSLRDAYSGHRVSAQQIVVEPGPIDLNMFDRCGFVGFVQSLVWPPFFTSTDPATIVTSVRSKSTLRILTSLGRRLKSAEVRDQLHRSSGILLSVRATRAGWEVTVTSPEPISAVALRFRGSDLQTPDTVKFEQALLASSKQQNGGWLCRGVYQGRHPDGVLQFAVQTEAAKIRSMSITLGGN